MQEDRRGWLVQDQIAVVSPAFTNLITGDCKCPKVELVSFQGAGNNVEVVVEGGNATLQLAGRMLRSPSIKVSNWNGQWNVQMVQGVKLRTIAHYTDGSVDTNFITGSPTTFCLDNFDPLTNATFTGSGTMTVDSLDHPSKNFSIADAAAFGIAKVEVLFNFETFVGYTLPINGIRRSLGILPWTMGGTVNFTNGTAFLSDPSNPGLQGKRIKILAKIPVFPSGWPASPPLVLRSATGRLRRWPTA